MRLHGSLKATRNFTYLFLAFALLLSACNAGSAATASPTAALPTPQASTPTQDQPAAPTEPPVAAPASTETSTQAVEPSPSATTQETTPTSAAAQTVTALPDPAGFAWNLVASGFNRPLDLSGAPDGSSRLFVLEQPGLIRIVLDGQMLPEAFLDISDRVGSQGNEQGLLGIAFHPRYPENGFFYLNYTDRSGDTVIARYSAVAGSPNSADPNSEMVLLNVDQPYANHNGGEMIFGPDGYLYIGLGDGGSGGDPQGNGQSLQTHLGKILRIDVDAEEPYAIPADNPFASGGGLPEIWAYGLRNPWRFSFDPFTGDIFIADVGQNQWEEVSYLPAEGGVPAGGANFGWNYREGAHPFEGEPPAGLNLIDPVAEYAHPTGCSITGGYVYRGQALPEFQGVYLYSDFCSGVVWGLLRLPDGSWQNDVLFETGANVTSFGLDEAGEIYLIGRGSGVYRLERGS